MMQVVGHLFIVQINGVAFVEECQTGQATGIIGQGTLAFTGNGNGFLEFAVEVFKTIYRFTRFFNEGLVFFS